MLSADPHGPPVTKTTVSPDLLHALNVITEFGVDVLGKNVHVLSSLEILLTVEEPKGDLELAGVLDDGHHLFNLIRRELSGPLVDVNLGLFADEVCHTASETLDLGQAKHHVTLSLHVCVENTQNVLKLGSLHQRRRPGVVYMRRNKAVESRCLS